MNIFPAGLLFVKLPPNVEDIFKAANLEGVECK